MKNIICDYFSGSKSCMDNSVKNGKKFERKEVRVDIGVSIGALGNGFVVVHK